MNAIKKFLIETFTDQEYIRDLMLCIRFLSFAMLLSVSLISLFVIGWELCNLIGLIF